MTHYTFWSVSEALGATSLCVRVTPLDVAEPVLFGIFLNKLGREVKTPFPCKYYPGNSGQVNLTKFYDVKRTSM